MLPPLFPGLVAVVLAVCLAIELSLAGVALSVEVALLALSLSV